MLRIVQTENGTVRGLPAADPRITSFKGIPFAAPPVGENRWRAPQPCADWDGVLKAYEFAPISVQDTPGLGDNIYEREWHVDPEIPMDEDCLYLNVWTPAKSSDEKLPVAVWYFGGGFQWGYTSEMEFDGERLARRGIIVVTVNYRLNVFGFLAHPEITAEQPDAPANFGMLDQQTGLKWVIRNIAAFGGDPQNITIAGQSAGGGSVMAQMTAPSNDGLFQRAIVHSAMIRSPYGEMLIGSPPSLETAEKAGTDFFGFIGASSLAEARGLDAIYIRNKYAEYAQNHPRMMIVMDNKFCVGDPMQLFITGKHPKVPIMTGDTADEFPTCIHASTEDEFKEKAKEIFGGDAEKFLSFEESKHKLGDFGYAPVSPIECSAKGVILRNEELGFKENYYYYKLNCFIPGWDNPGNFHSVDLWFFFETLAKCWRPFDGKYYDLSRQMCNYWVNFVKTGNPNGNDIDGTPMPEWKPYTKEEPCSMFFLTEGAKQNIAPEPEFKSFLIDKLIKDIESGKSGS